MTKKNLQLEPLIHEEKKLIRRITFRSAFEDFLDAWNFQRGLLYTLKLLFIYPGKLIERYFGIERYKIYPPFKLLIITTTVALLVTLQLNLNHQLLEGMYDGFPANGEIAIDRIKIESVFNDYYNLILWSSIPIFALALFLIIRRSFNYIEHLIIYTFYTSAINFLYLALVPTFLFTSVGLPFYFIFSFAFFLFIYIKALGLNKWHHYVRLFFAYLVGSILYSMLVFIFMAGFLL